MSSKHMVSNRIVCILQMIIFSYNDFRIVKVLHKLLSYYTVICGVEERSIVTEKVFEFQNSPVSHREPDLQLFRRDNLTFFLFTLIGKIIRQHKTVRGGFKCEFFGKCTWYIRLDNFRLWKYRFTQAFTKKIWIPTAFFRKEKHVHQNVFCAYTRKDAFWDIFKCNRNFTDFFYYFLFFGNIYFSLM